MRVRILRPASPSSFATNPEKYNITPRAVDREVTESLHRSTMGVDQDYKSLLSQASRAALADGWGGAMLATELQAMGAENLTLYIDGFEVWKKYGGASSILPESVRAVDGVEPVPPVEVVR